MRGKRHSPEAKARISAAQRGPQHHNWNGGRWKSSDGYIFVQMTPEHRFAEMRSSRGYVKEHRLVLAESLGRPLTPGEVAHHVNEIRDDNRLENLQLFESKATHVRFHRKLRNEARIS
jgi:hypothetical protein